MSKTRYIKFDNEKLERSPSNLAIIAAKTANKAVNLMNTSIEKANELFIKAKHFGQEAIMFGSTGGAYILAYLNFNGHGTRKDIEKAKLWLLIGATEAFGDKICSSLVNDKKDIGSLMKGYLQMNPTYSEKQKKLAKMYTETIYAIIEDNGGLKKSTQKSKTIEDCIVAKGVFNEDSGDSDKTLQVLGGLYNDESGDGGCCECTIL